MNKKALLLLFFIIFKNISAQRYEIGVQLGMSNLVGDVGNTNFVLQKPIHLGNGGLASFGIPFYGGLVYRMNFNPYQTLRFNVGYSHIQFDDAYAKENYRRNRGYYGTNSTAEVDALFEYYFLPVNNEQKSMLSPYIFGGIGTMVTNVPRMTIANDFYRNLDGTPISPDQVTPDMVVNGQQGFTTTVTQSTAKAMTLAIPFGVGLKYKFNYNWAISGEFMFRPTFSDELDYSNITDKNVKVTYSTDIKDPSNDKRSLLRTSPYSAMAAEREQEILQKRRFGNTNSKDWVNSASLILSYSFGRPPCNCDQ